jgi:hypothetical protein
MKAFLSHATPDKSYVDRVAEFLGRESVLYDRFSFDHGSEFSKEIIRGLDKTAVFVLFLSKHSIGRLWVDFELAEAETRVLAA